MKILMVPVLALLFSAAVCAGPIEDDYSDFYESLTQSAEFNYRPEYVFEKHEPNNLYADLSVSVVASVPFGFILSSAALYINKAVEQSRWDPQIGTLEDNKLFYTVSVSVFAAAAALANLIIYY
jgi:hypothetical protein